MRMAPQRAARPALETSRRTGKLKPLQESQFQSELRTSFHRAYPKNARSALTYSISGEPDLVLEFVTQRGRSHAMHVECKYVHRPPTHLRAVWDLLRGIQKVTMTNMARAGKSVYIAVCVAGEEVLWYTFNQAQCRKVEEGKMPDWTVLHLDKVSPRWGRGLFRSGQDYGVDTVKKSDYDLDLKS